MIDQLLKNFTWKHGLATATGVIVGAVMMASQAAAWDIRAMNKHIDQTNFIVGNGCSGTLVDIEERLILTNHHCIDQAIKTRSVDVTGPDGMVSKQTIEDLKPVPVSQRSYDGHEVVGESTYMSEIVGYNKDLDLGLLQLRAVSIPQTLEAELFLGDVQRGEIAYVVGNPLGMDATVMKGVISSTNRKVRVGLREAPYLQVDAGITGGNSGGALYNDEGLFIGVPGAAARGTVVGLAVPVKFVIEFLDDNCWSNVYDNEFNRDECLNPTEEDENEDS